MDSLKVEKEALQRKRKELNALAHRLQVSAGQQLNVSNTKWKHYGDISVSVSFHPISKVLFVLVDGAVTEEEGIETLRTALDPTRKEEWTDSR